MVVGEGVNVYLYVALIALGGLLASYYFGYVAGDLGLGGAAVLFPIMSIVCGIVFSVGVTFLVSSLCSMLGIAERQCVNTDDTTVWWLALPLVAIPVYILCMFIGRAVANSPRLPKQDRASDNAINSDTYSARFDRALDGVRNRKRS